MEVSDEHGVPLAISEPEVIEAHEVDMTWAAHPTRLDLLTHGGNQFVAYYDAEGRMSVAKRRLTESTWEHARLPVTLGWDSHNHLTLGVDARGHVHLSGRMHDDPLIYFRTTEPLDITTLERVPAMVGEGEEHMTYPRFSTGPDGNLLFSYRSGASGKGDLWFNEYDVEQRQWRRLAPGPVIDGERVRSAYAVGPTLGDDRWWHLVWVWRDTNDAATNHDLSYARSRDLVNWENGAGEQLPAPIRFSTGEVVDPVPVLGGLINNNTRLGFDGKGRPVIAYHKHDDSGHTQLYNARLEDGRWTVHRTSSWRERWEFGGGGTLVFKIEVDGVQALPDGRLLQRWFHADLGGWGAFVLDEETLQAIEEIPAPIAFPRELAAPRGSDPRCEVRWKSDSQPHTGDDRYLLRWETLEANRDAPRNDPAPPSALEVYRVRGGVKASAER